MRKKLTTYIEEENLKELKIKAIEENCSVADILNILVESYLKNNEELEYLDEIFCNDADVDDENNEAFDNFDD